MSRTQSARARQAPTTPASVPALHRVDGENADVCLVRGDNVRALQALRPSLEKQVTLVYLDPPFFTMRQHERVVRKKVPSGPPVRILAPAFDDRWKDLPAYLAAIRQRLEALQPLLAPHGSVVVHVDPRTSHYIKVMGDEIFGANAFASEIIWRYRRWPAKTPNFQRVHDVLLRWVADPTVVPRFVQLYEELAPSTVKTWGKGKQRAVFDQGGRRRRSSTESTASPGAPLGDVWEIPILAPVAKERTGYPTQKPEALLRRLIEACSAPGDLVLDPYVGSGTTMAVAAKLGRRSVGIDASPTAIGVTRARLRDAGHEVSEYVIRASDRSGHAIEASIPHVS
ncbi:MAG: DNA-methyltransferase [Myxococcota bacterium]